MGASPRKDDAVQYSRVRRARPAAVLSLSLTLALVAACGGDRSRAAGGSDTTGAAAMPTDTATAPAAETPAPPAPDTGAKAAAPEPAAAKPAAPKPAEPKPAAAKPAAPKPAAPAPQDTAPKAAAAAPAKPAAPAQPAETTKAPAPAPAPSQTADVPLRDEYHQPPRDTVSAAVYDGWKQYNLNCARCHGEDALGTTIAPHLILSLKPDGAINTKELFMQVVCAGRPEKGMPAWCALGLDMGKIDDIYQYVKGRSDAKISPGRPAVKSEG